MQRQLCSAGKEAQICIAWQGWQLRCYRMQVFVFNEIFYRVDFAIAWTGEAEVVLPGSHGILHFVRVRGSGLSVARLLQAGVSVRSRKGSEHIKLDAARPRQSLRKLLPQQAIPPWQREQLPLLYCGDELVCVPGVAIAGAYAAQAEEEGVLVSWQYWASMTKG